MTGVTADHFAVVLGRGVAQISRLDVRGQRAAQGGKPTDKGGGDARCLLAVFGTGTIVVRRLTRKAQAGLDLFGKAHVKPLYVDTDAVLHRAAVHRRTAVVAREEDGAAQPDDFLQHRT